MEIDATGSDARMTTEPVRIEWNWDFDDRWQVLKGVGLGDQKYTFGEEGRIRLKGRCRRCWGGLIGKRGGEDAPTAIRCRVCGIILEGEEAKEEYYRLLRQDSKNMFNIALGLPTKYHDNAMFVSKVLPYMDRQTENEFRQRVKVEAARGEKRGWLTRNEFPAGSAGFLVLQARALMSGVERLPRELSLARFPDIELHDDGSATASIPEAWLGEHSKTSQYELMKRLGSTMTIAMMSAFACELAMKAICLTRRHEARKSHDLWKLYQDLPADSRKRIEEDYPKTDSALRRARHTFDKWRYFEANVGGQGIGAMIDTERTFNLAKVARVLLDEAEMMGLGYSLDFEATRRITQARDRQHVDLKHSLSIKGTEAPPL